MRFFETLRDCFERVARWNKDPAQLRSQELLEQINSIKEIRAAPLQRKVTVDPNTLNIHFEWVCLMAERHGPAAGMQTKFFLKWSEGTGTWVAGRLKPEGMQKNQTSTGIHGPVPLERLLRIMAEIQTKTEKVYGITPCPLYFERTHMNVLRDLVREYRLLNPRHLASVKKESENKL